MKLAPFSRFVLKHREFAFNFHQIGILNYIKFPMTKYTCTFFFLVLHILEFKYFVKKKFQNLKTKNVIKFRM